MAMTSSILYYTPNIMLNGFRGCFITDCFSSSALICTQSTGLTTNVNSVVPRTAYVICCGHKQSWQRGKETQRQVCQVHFLEDGIWEKESYEIHYDSPFPPQIRVWMTLWGEWEQKRMDVVGKSQKSLKFKSSDYKIFFHGKKWDCQIPI